MVIDLKNVSKRYSQEWILKRITFSFDINRMYGISGSNGSGKSTLVKIISGYLSPSRGDVLYTDKDGQQIDIDHVYKQISWWGPHVKLISELTIEEMLDYYSHFKKFRSELSKQEVWDLVGLKLPMKQRVGSLSSGQAQRIGLSLSILAQTDLLLLDEPSSYLDESSMLWLYDLIQKFSQDRVVIISSNDPRDLHLVSETIQIEDYK